MSRVLDVLGPVAVRQRDRRVAALRERVGTLEQMDAAAFIAGETFVLGPVDDDFDAARAAIAELLTVLEQDVTYVEFRAQDDAPTSFYVRASLSCAPWIIVAERIDAERFARAWGRD